MQKTPQIWGHVFVASVYGPSLRRSIYPQLQAILQQAAEADARVILLDIARLKGPRASDMAALVEIAGQAFPRMRL
ncbi:MAG: hypothetical protein ACU0DW_05185, partial [Shimia sp.]